MFHNRGNTARGNMKNTLRFAVKKYEYGARYYVTFEFRKQPGIKI